VEQTCIRTEQTCIRIAEGILPIKMKHVLSIIANKMLPMRHVSLHFPWYCRPCPCHWEAVGMPWAMYVVLSKNSKELFKIGE